uniref:PHD-type domain-containing protein n=1 Tax=Heterorhabditis bacteriophora TaxID=37862 RepID=A0A1I7XIU6_HETBA
MMKILMSVSPPLLMDQCGLAVHDSCYLPPDIGEDAESTQSSSSTEPWFCEPCIYGLIEPPHCELCPIRHGAFKRSDIGGRWVHLICALYTRGITFGDIDHLGAVSWQEMDHRNFGRKSCSGCTNKLEARTGVATRCELGMCKEYFHTTCAQRLGLLVDHSEDYHLNAGDESQTVEPRYINCKKHSNSDDVRVKRLAFNRFLVQEEKRMLMVRRKVLTEREERKRLHALRKHDKRNQSLIGVTICWPDASWDKYEKKVRRGRQLHTSARYLEAFQEKAELIDVDKEQFEQANTFIQTSDQHLLIGCDSCHNYYHLGCLDPPLEKMPRKINCDWYCSACCGESGDDDDEQQEHDEIAEDSSNDGISNRKLRQRSDSTRAKRMAEAEEQTRAYKAAIAAGGRNMHKRGRSLGEAVSNTRKLQKRRTIDSTEPTITAKKQKGALEKSNGNKLNGRASVLSNVSLNASGRSGKTVRGSQSGRSSRVSLRSEDLGLGEDSFVVLEDEVEEEL